MRELELSKRLIFGLTVFWDVTRCSLVDSY